LSAQNTVGTVYQGFQLHSIIDQLAHVKIACLRPLTLYEEGEVIIFELIRTERIV